MAIAGKPKQQDSDYDQRGIKLSAADTVHLASAIIYEADVCFIRLTEVVRKSAVSYCP